MRLLFKRGQMYRLKTWTVYVRNFEIRFTYTVSEQVSSSRRHRSTTNSMLVIFLIFYQLYNLLFYRRVKDIQNSY